MDRSLYVAMSGAAQAQNAMSVHANNLANVSTRGFKADLEQARAMTVFGPVYPSRAYAMIEEPSTNMAMGSIENTGNPLDVVPSRGNWIAVQGPNGQEAYTQAGDLQIGADRTLRNGAGFAVLGSNGKPLQIPQASRVEIGEDGSVYFQAMDGRLTDLAVLDKIKLVQLDPSQISKGVDGLMHLPAGSKLPLANASATVVKGSVESSNVNAVAEMTHIIEVSRQYEMQIKFMQDAQNNDQSLAQIMQGLG